MIDLFAVSHGLIAHLCVSLFLFSSIAYIVSFSANKYVVQFQARQMGRWALWIASITALATAVVGVYAYSSSSHDDYSHVLLNNHRNIAAILTLVIIVLALWVAVLFNDDKEESKHFLALNVIALIGVLYVAWSGSVLVHQYGVGVSRIPDSQSHHHRTFKRITEDSSLPGQN